MAYVFSCDKIKSEKALNEFQKLILPQFKDFNEGISEVYIGKHVYQKHVVVEEIDVALRIAQTEWYQLQSMVMSENIIPFSEMVYSRDLVNSTFTAFLESLQLCDCCEQKERYMTSITRALNNFSNSVVPLKKFQDDILLKISTSAMNDPKCPVYQYFHSFLDIKYHLLALDYICGASEEKLEKRISAAMQDLLLITKINYKRYNMQNRRVFICNCVRNFWLILQLLTEKVSANREWFWKMFNSVLEDEDAIFSLWLLKDISSLHSVNNILIDQGNKSDRIIPNYNLLENKLKIILSNSGSDACFECFKLIHPLVSNLWLKQARIEVFQIIWDHYSKRLNISNKKPPQKALDFNKTIDTILNLPKDCNEDFEIFVGMLVMHLKEYPHHWGKIKGRIYSQLGPNKVKDLNEIGVTHVTELFLSLTNINFNELSKKAISFLENLPAEKRNTQNVWTICSVIIIRLVSENHDVEAIVPVMLQMLHEAANDQKQFRLIKEFIENFEHIINHSPNYQLHQWLLLDNSWLGKYLTACYHADLKTALNILLSVLDKVKDADSWPLWETTFRESVYPILKLISNAATTPDAVGKIAGKLCLLMPNITNEAFGFFCNETVPPKIACQFVDEVLKDFPNNFILTSLQESLILQSWVKVCLLTPDLSNNLTENVVKLDCFPVTLKSHISTSQDSIYAFIEYLGSDIKQHVRSTGMIKLCEICFGTVDKWLGQYLTHPDDETIVFRIYTCISLAFLHCGPLLYDRNKSTSPLTKLVQVLLLPSNFLIGKKIPHTFVLNGVRKTWHLFFEAIVKLNKDNDTFLERTLRDMILKYVNFFSTGDSPILKCLENVLTAPILLEKISNSYFKHPVKESDANMLKVMKILNDFVQSTTSVPLIRLIINKCLYGLFDIVIFHTQRNAALGAIKVLTSSPLYAQVKEDFSSSVVAVTEKHLAFNTINYFQLMYILAKFVPSDIKSLLGNIKQHLSNVERMRGVGFDQNLRLQFEKLENAVEVSK